MNVQLLPTAARLKQLITEHGDVWLALTEPAPLQCFNNDDGVCIRSPDGTHVRNVRINSIVACTKAKAMV